MVIFGLLQNRSRRHLSSMKKNSNPFSEIPLSWVLSKIALLDSVVAKRRTRGQVVTTTIFCRENGLLKETKSELEHAIAETERPLRFLKICPKTK